MTSFAERMGLRAVRSKIQTDELDEETRIELWNLTHLFQTALSDSEREHRESTNHDVLKAIWIWEFKKPADEQPGDVFVWQKVKDRILSNSWSDCLDLIENLVKYIDRYHTRRTSEWPKVMADAYNIRFESYLVGYRFISLKITPIDTGEQSQAISDAVEDAQSISGARHHLSRALELLADRQSPDYPNSIKESISAVEAVCVSMTGEKTLGTALKKLEGAGVTIHSVLKDAWSKMYGWTSDADGIRHGKIVAPDADQALAKYMLVTCSAFVSYLIEISRKAQLV